MVQFLRGLNIVPGQETNESLDTGPGPSRSSPQIVVEQLRDEVLVVKLGTCHVSRGQGT